MRKIRVMTNDPYLWQKIYLILKKEYEPIRAEAVGDDVTLVDIDAYPNEAGGIRMSREVECELSIPFSDEMLFAAIGGDDKRAARLTLDGRTAHLDGEDIRLTEVEAALLSRLMREGGGFVERSVLLSDVWGEDADGGIINVYVHYLREKLEKRGEKIILSSRSHGYKISEKYLMGGVADA